MMLSQGMLLCVRPPCDASTSVTECPHPINSPVWPRSPPSRLWQGTSQGARLGAGLPCPRCRLFSSGEASGPAGCRRAGTAWPILNRLHKESAAPARIFSELYLSKHSAGEGKGGGREQLLLAPQPAAHLRQRWSALPAATLTMLGVRSQLLAVCPPGWEGGAPNPALSEHPSKCPASERRRGPVWVPSIPRAGGSGAQRGLVPGSRTDGKSRRGARSSARMKAQLDAAEDTGKAQKHPKKGAGETSCYKSLAHQARL